MAGFQAEIGKTINDEVRKNMMIYNANVANARERAAEVRPSFTLRPSFGGLVKTPGRLKKRLGGGYRETKPSQPRFIFREGFPPDRLVKRPNKDDHFI